MATGKKQNLEWRILKWPLVVAAGGVPLVALAGLLGLPHWLYLVLAALTQLAGLWVTRRRLRKETIEWTQQAQSALVMRSLGDLVATVPSASNHEFDMLAVRWNELLDTLAEQAGRYERTIEYISDGIATLNTNMMFRTVNPAGARLLGCRDAGELVGENFRSFMMLPETLEDIFDAEHGCDFQCRTRDGREVLMRAEATWHHEGEDTIGMVVFRNITAQRELEDTLERARDAALQNAKLKAEFLANMSHEIRTPMNGLLGMVELLKDTGLDAEQEELARTMASSAESLLRIINDILDFSKIESGKLTIEKTAFNLEQLTEEMLTLVKLKASEKSIALTVDIQEDVPHTVQGDPTRVRQVLLNLVGNSVKFTEKGGVSLSISRATEFKREALKFEVKDTGIGMTPDQCKNVFTQFVQADTSTTRRFGGTGLGLSISKQLVELMDGQIDVASEAGVGSTFTVYIPLPEARASDAEETEPQDDDSAPVAFDVLLVDDNSVNQTVARRFLEKLGCTVTVAANGQQALEQVQAKCYDIVFMDCQMPVMDGFDATRAIRLLDGSCRDVRIVAMTANAMKGDRERCIEAGMDDYLTKPIRVPLLKKALARGTARHVEPQTA